VFSGLVGSVSGRGVNVLLEVGVDDDFADFVLAAGVEVVVVIEAVALSVAEARNTPIFDILEACDCRAETCGATVVLSQRLIMFIMTTSIWVEASVRSFSRLYVTMHC